MSSTPLTGLITMVSDIINMLLPLLLSVAVLLFFWGLVKYIANASDEEAKKAGKDLMIWGVIAVVVMVSFWGIVGFVQTSIGLSGSAEIIQAPVYTP